MTRWFLAILVLVVTTAPVVGDRSAADRALRQGNRAEAVRIDVPKGTVGLGRDFAVSASFRDRFSVSACNDLVSKNHLVRVA